MPLTRYYLPEQHSFEHVAIAPWPKPQIQMDWVDGVITMEHWLEKHIGQHFIHWAWATQRDHNSWEACVAFKYDKHKTLFLLQWA